MSQSLYDQPEAYSPWQWYRSGKRKTKISLLYTLLITALLLGLYAEVILSRENSISTRYIASKAQSTVLSATGMALSRSLGQLTTKPLLILTSPPQPIAKLSATPHVSNTPAPSPAIYYGVHVSLQNLAHVTAFEADAKKPVSIVMWYQHWGLTDGYQYFQPGWMHAVRRHGSIPLVTWDPWVPPQGPNQPNEPAYALQNIINGNFDSYITKWAQDSKAWGHPYFLRFAQEMNGNWNPWSEMVNGNKPGQFVLAWRHVHDIFMAQGATNVSWVWCPNIDYPGSKPLKGLYPGDMYVDWVGMDGYNWGTVENHTWQNFQPLFQKTYSDILAITSKPLMIAETASTEHGGNKANWITDAYTQLPHYFPRIGAIIWFNQDKETDWSIESSPASQNAFVSAIQSSIYASNKYANLKTSPIPAP